MERSSATGARAGRSKRFLAVAAVAMLAVTAGCSDDDGGEEGTGNNTDDTIAEAASLLGPENLATGDPIKVGFFSDGVTEAFDNTDELRAAEATTEYVNTHMGGIAGRPIELVTCETAGDAAKAVDCANKFITEGVVVVTQSQSAAAGSVWEPLHAAGIPTFFTQANSPEMEVDPNSFMVFNPSAVFFGLPIAVAESEDTKKIAFVVIDVPQAVEIIEQNGEILTEAGYEYELVRVPIGTADMTAQMQLVASSGAGVAHVVGNDAFCIAAFQGLNAVAYQGATSAISQCFTDATREAMPQGLEGINVLSTLALGATDDPSYQLFQAVMTEYGTNVSDVDNLTSLGGYAAIASLATALQDLSGEVTMETVVSAIKAMPESEYPGGGGMTYQCGGSAAPASPAVCTNQWLRTELDAAGNPTAYTVEDSSALFDA